MTSALMGTQCVGYVFVNDVFGAAVTRVTCATRAHSVSGASAAYACFFQVRFTSGAYWSCACDRVCASVRYLLCSVVEISSFVLFRMCHADVWCRCAGTDLRDPACGGPCSGRGYVNSSMECACFPPFTGTACLQCMVRVCAVARVRSGGCLRAIVLVTCLSAYCGVSFGAVRV